MPVSPPISTAPYDSVQQVLNAARVRLNDAIETPAGAPAGQIGGEVISDLQPFTLVMLNSGWRRLQEFLASLGFERLENEQIIQGLPVVGNADPGIRTAINWQQYFDGQNVWPSPTLPQDIMFPLRLWERVSVTSGTPNSFTPMENIQEGIADQPRQARNYAWEWLNDSIVMPGSTSIMDLKLRYMRYLPDFLTTGGVEWYNQAVPIMRCLDALAWYVCSEAANARGDIDGAQFDTKAEAAATKLAQREKTLQMRRQQWVIPDIPAAPGNTPYDSVSTMLNTVRVRLNAAKQLAGDIVTSSEQFTQQCVNTGWRKMQEFLASLGFERLIAETIIEGVPIAGTADEGLLTALTWNGFFDGVTQNPNFVLPRNLIAPLRMWERTTGGSGIGSQFSSMEFIQNGIASQPKTSRNYAWSWNNDTLYMPGSTVQMDLRIRYAQYLGDFVNGTTAWYLQAMSISRCLDAMAWYTALEFTLARPDLEIDPEPFKTKAEEAAKLLAGRDTQQAALRSEWIITDIPPATGNTPYDVVSTIVNTARVRLNRAAKGTGDVVCANQPFMQQVFNTAYRRLQEWLANRGYIRTTDEVILTNVPPTLATDPSTQVSLSWAGYFNGVSLVGSPALPNSLMFPLKAYERVTGTNALFTDMEQFLDGLPTVPLTTYNRIWEWRADGMYLPGAIMATDIRIRFVKYLPDFQSSSTVPWYLQQVPIVRCLDALSLYVCVEVANARPDLELDEVEYQTQAETASQLIFNRDVRMKQRVNIRRKSRSGRLEYGGYRTGQGGY